MVTPGTGGRRGTALRGRGVECRALEGLIAGVGSGRSQVLVVRGEAGIGKTALLEYLGEYAAGFRVVWTTGVQSDMELAYAGLQQLCAPLLDHRERLPVPQRSALETAFGLSDGATPDRFLVGLAVLGLMAGAAADQPLVCLIDDAQWLDRVSAQTLAFVAHRLLIEPVVLAFAVRKTGDDALAGLPELTIGGLSTEAAQELLESATPGRLDERVRDRIVAESRGNPLALLELPREYPAAQLAGGFGQPGARAPSGQVEHSFLRRVRDLPDDTRLLLLTAAAEPIGDPLLLRSAVERLGISLAAIEPAEAAGLIEIGNHVRFRHPLVRAVVYHDADSTARRQVHRALAEGTDPRSDPDRRAWHRAHAAAEPAEDVAAALERSADRAQIRGGVAAAATFLARAAELTPDPARRGARLLAAARATFGAADPDAVYRLLAAAEQCPLDDVGRARVTWLRAQVMLAHRRVGDATRLLLDAAKRLEELDPAGARDTYLEALGLAIFAGRLGDGHGVREVAEAARGVLSTTVPVRPTEVLLDALVVRFAEGYQAGVPALRDAVATFRLEATQSRPDTMRWLWLVFPAAQEAAAHELWDLEAWRELAGCAVRLAREAAALAVLPGALMYSAGVQLHTGDFATASAMIGEANAIAAATGCTPITYAALVLAAWRDPEAEVAALIDASVAEAIAGGEGRVIGLAGYATAVLYNGCGQYERALAGAQQACEHEDLGFFGWSLAELVEAAARLGLDDAAAAALRRLEERTVVSGTDWALGMLARTRALTCTGRDAESWYREAIDRLERSRVVVHLARARLLYGEWLRREHRRVDAREQLHSAHDAFSRMGAQRFAERARRELLATGESVRRRREATPGALTPQEAQIARLAGDGLTNSEIGAQLFISAHTVEWHLRKVFAKLGITSRRQLRGMLPAR